MSSDKKHIRSSATDFLVFTAQQGEGSFEVRYEDETIWLTQKLMAELFDVSKSTISEHCKNIFAEGEVSKKATVRNFRTVQLEGNREVNRELEHYSLDAIISVGYRVNSVRATQFRQWATQVLKDFAIQGYVLDRKRMENGSFLGEDYFEKLLEEIREIRLSERRFYQKVTDVYATAMDYNKDAPTTRAFFATVQNKLHFALHGRTASEVLTDRANHEEQNMGLVTWANAPDGRVLKSDVSTAKNYLSKDELSSLGRIVNAYFELAEERAKRQIPMTMEDWAKRLDAFLEFDDREILQGKGSVSAKEGKTFAETEFEKYRPIQEKLLKSDYDKAIEASLKSQQERNDDAK